MFSEMAKAARASGVKVPDPPPYVRTERRVHHLKAWPEFFQKLKTREKNFEVRRNDRDYRVGDTLFIREWDPREETFTGEEPIAAEVTYVLGFTDIPCAPEVSFSVVEPVVMALHFLDLNETLYRELQEVAR